MKIDHFLLPKYIYSQGVKKEEKKLSRLNGHNADMMDDGMKSELSHLKKKNYQFTNQQYKYTECNDCIVNNHNRQSQQPDQQLYKTMCIRK